MYTSREVKMDDLKKVVAKNISELRLKNGITQLELAEKLNYSDKAVSKWERGESLPDISVLRQLSDIFGVSLDYLVEEDHTEDKFKYSNEAAIIEEKNRKNRIFITGMSLILVWIIAAFIFMILHQLNTEVTHLEWMSFIYALPVTFIVWLVLNSVWFNKRNNFLIISLLMWTTLTAIYLSFLVFMSLNLWLIFALGVLGQVIILLWSRIKTQ